MWIPIKYHDGSGEKSSGNESDDSVSRQSMLTKLLFFLYNTYDYIILVINLFSL